MSTKLAKVLCIVCKRIYRRKVFGLYSYLQPLRKEKKGKKKESRRLSKENFSYGYAYSWRLWMKPI